MEESEEGPCISEEDLRFKNIAISCGIFLSVEEYFNISKNILIRGTEEQYGNLCFRNTFEKVDVDGSGEINMQVKHHQPKQNISRISRRKELKCFALFF